MGECEAKCKALWWPFGSMKALYKCSPFTISCF